MNNPAEEYRTRLGAREQQLTLLEKRFARLGAVRLALFALLAIGAWWSIQLSAFSPWWLLLPATAFVATVVHHGRVRRARARARRAAAFHRNGLKRIDYEWAGHGRQGEQFNDAHHVYAADLDLFGAGGLFELLSVARTPIGERTLAGWLLAPADTDTIMHRQQAAAELAPAVDFRERWATPGDSDVMTLDSDALRHWAQQPNQLTQRWIAPVAWALPALLIAAIVAWTLSGLLAPLLTVLLIQLAVMAALRSRLQSTLSATEGALSDLELLQALLRRMEQQAFQAPALRTLTARLRQPNASRSLTGLLTAGQLIESRRNPILRVLDIPLMYSVHAARLAEAWRSRHGQALPDWLDAVGEFEALLSIATWHFEHPEDAFPELLSGEAALHAEGLGHPLLSDQRCVKNDVSITDGVRLLLISGSNMSGKSTLMRAVGLNTVLAMAGAPVRAKSMKLTPLQVGASIRVNDSLHEGSSRFFAEITRLRSIQTLCGGSPPLLFLLDEILQGTNSRDRLVGAEAVVRAFLNRGAIGIVSTHDLALTEIDRDGHGRVRNLHFEDDLDNGTMRFDYRLREGVVTKSNGVALMRSIGLDV